MYINTILILVIENKIHILDLYIHEAHLLLYDYSLLSLDNVPMCNCGEVALLLTVRREDSINKGKNSNLCIHDSMPAIKFCQDPLL